MNLTDWMMVVLYVIILDLALTKAAEVSNVGLLQLINGMSTALAAVSLLAILLPTLRPAIISTLRFILYVR